MPDTVNYNDSTQKQDFRTMQILIWIYFYLLIFEGALRKWVLPGLSDLFLIVRDPIAIALVILALKQRIFKDNSYVKLSYAACFLAFFTTMIWGHANLFVAIYGLRIYVLHFPLIFIIAKVFTLKDVLKMGKVLLWIAIPMAVLIALQFYSPQSAWVNRGVGGSLDGAGFSGANGYFRPPGVFSFTSGNTTFWGLIAAFTAFFLLQRKIISNTLLLAVVCSVMAAIVFSISRSLFAQVGISILFLLFIVWRKPGYVLAFLFGSMLILILTLSLSKTGVFGTGLDALSSRFESASEIEGSGFGQSMIDRFFGGMFSAISNDPNLSFWGKGIGMGTNAGAKLMTGNLAFLISEGEWGRLVGESGLFLGLTFILLRVVLVGQMLRDTIRIIPKGNTLPWLLLSFGLIIMLQGQWAQPTSLGFAVLTGGLILAAMRNPNKKSPKTEIKI